MRERWVERTDILAGFVNDGGAEALSGFSGEWERVLLEICWVLWRGFLCVTVDVLRFGRGIDNEVLYLSMISFFQHIFLDPF